MVFKKTEQIYQRDGTTHTMDIYTKEEKDFSIEIKRFDGMLYENCWCLYVYIKKSHPMYKFIEKLSIEDDYDFGDKIYPHFHEGCTFLKKENESFKIGCDYQHCFDDIFVSSNIILPTLDKDAEKLYNFFKEWKEEQWQS